MATPKVGDNIYIESTVYVTHGVDDFRGGVCTIKAVRSHLEKNKETVRVEVEEDAGTWYTWTGYLESRQEEWKTLYGEQKGGPQPDYRPEFNDEHESWDN